MIFWDTCLRKPDIRPDDPDQRVEPSAPETVAYALTAGESRLWCIEHKNLPAYS